MDMEDRFLVINRKRFDEVNNAPGPHMTPWHIGLHAVVQDFKDSLDRFVKSYTDITGKDLDQRYIVCNQDEPYADEVWRVIREGEAKKRSTIGG